MESGSDAGRAQAAGPQVLQTQVGRSGQRRISRAVRRLHGVVGQGRSCLGRREAHRPHLQGTVPRPAGTTGVERHLRRHFRRRADHRASKSRIRAGEHIQGQGKDFRAEPRQSREKLLRHRHPDNGTAGARRRKLQHQAGLRKDRNRHHPREIQHIAGPQERQRGDGRIRRRLYQRQASRMVQPDSARRERGEGGGAAQAGHRRFQPPAGIIHIKIPEKEMGMDAAGRSQPSRKKHASFARAAAELQLSPVLR